MLDKSWIGVWLDVVRLDETAASVFGLKIGYWKILAFTLGNFLAGLMGAVYAKMTGFIAPANFTFGDSLVMVSIVILGGIGNRWGVLPAALIVVVVVMDFTAQVQAHLVSHQYESLLKKANLKGYGRGGSR